VYCCCCCFHGSTAICNVLQNSSNKPHRDSHRSHSVHLVVVFDAHAERVEENGHENSTLEVLAVDQLLHAQSHSAQVPYNHKVNQSLTRTGLPQSRCTPASSDRANLIREKCLNVSKLDWAAFKLVRSDVDVISKLCHVPDPGRVIVISLARAWVDIPLCL